MFKTFVSLLSGRASYHADGVPSSLSEAVFYGMAVKLPSVTLNPNVL